MRSCSDASYAAGYSDALTDLRRLAGLSTEYTAADVNAMIDTLREINGAVPVRVKHRVRYPRHMRVVTP